MRPREQVPTASTAASRRSAWTWIEPLRGRLGFFGLLGVLVTTGLAPAWAAYFDPVPDLIVPASFSKGAALGDIDLDGDLDVALGTHIYRNDCGGGFVPIFSSEGLGGFATLADVDGDGYVDFLTRATAGIALFRNEQGAFHEPATWSTTEAWRIVDLADIDLDGDLDLVAHKWPYDSLFRNDGGVFTTTGVWSTLDGDAALAVGDVDNDGDLDVVGTNEVGIVWYRNDSGALTTSPVWSSTSGSALVGKLGDIDGDGDLDLVTSSPNRLHRNDGGSFVLDPSWTPGFGTETMALGDVDGDGDLDFALAGEATEDGTPATLYRNDGGTFTSAPVWSSVPPLDAQTMAVGDVDGDGDLDLLGFGSLNWALYVFRNETVGFPAAGPWSVFVQPACAAVGDVDNDGDLDLVSNVGAANTLFRNDDGVFEASWEVSGNGVLKDLLGDVDGDGDPDLVAVTRTAGARLFRNEDGVFASVPSWQSDSTGFADGALADMDGDGDPDLVIGTALDGCRVYRNEGTGTFTTMPVDSTQALRILSLALGDVDRDGDPDLMACTSDYPPPGPPFTPSLLMFRNDGGAVTTDPVWWSQPVNGGAIAMGDVDADGDLDIAVGGTSYRSPITLYRNDDGTLTTTPTWTQLIPKDVYSIEFVDVDADGDLDLVAGANDDGGYGGLGVFLNTGGTFPSTADWTEPGDWTVTVPGDMDGDGDVDLVRGDVIGGLLEIRLGLRTPAYAGDPLAPTNHLPNNSAHLRDVRQQPVASNLRRVSFRAIDVESDPVWIVADYQYEGAPTWYPVDTGATPLGPFASSPSGAPHQFDWDITQIPFDDRKVVLRLRAISHPTRAGLIRHVATYSLDVGRIEPSRPEVSTSANSLVFSTVTLGSKTSTALRVTNIGSEPLSVTAIHTPSPEMAVSPGNPFDLNPGASQDLEVVLAPETELAIAGDLEILSNDPLKPRVVIPVETDIRDLRVETRGLTQDPEIPVGDAFTVLVIPFPEVVVERGSLFHRPAGSGLFSEIVLAGDGGSFVGVIPGEAVTERDLEYYVEVHNGSVSRTSPPGAPVDSVFFQKVRPPSSFLTAPQPGAAGRFLAGRSINVQALLPEGTQFIDGALSFRQGGETAYRQVPFTVAELLPSATIPDSLVGARGIEYWAQIRTATQTLTDPGTDPAGSPWRIRTSIVDLEEEATSPGGRYRMVSVPLVMDPDFQGTMETLLSDQSEFGPYDPTRWRLFRYDAGAATSVEFTSGTTFRPEPGRGFWFIARAEHRIDTAPATAMSTPTDQPFPVVLQPGWNQVGNPFAFPVAWSAVLRPGAVGEPIAFDPALNDYLEDPPSLLQPFAAYFLRNASTQPVTVLIPPAAAVAGRAAEMRPASAEAGWRIRVEGRGVDARGGSITVGTYPGALAEFDPLDREQPPPPPDATVRLAVRNDDWPSRAGLYRRDLRDPESEGHVWSLEVLTRAAADPVSLGFADIALPAGTALRVVDLEQSVRVDPEATREYRLLGLGPLRPYRLAILGGDASFVNRETERLAGIPAHLSLERSAPNPSRGAVRIRFGLPDPADARLTIFDLAGRRVSTLVDSRRLPAGFHSIVWDATDDRGRRVSAGVYFYRLESSGAMLTGKTVLLR